MHLCATFWAVPQFENASSSFLITRGISGSKLLSLSSRLRIFVLSVNCRSSHISRLVARSTRTSRLSVTSLFRSVRARVHRDAFPICVHLRPSVVKLPSHSFVLKPCANVTARSRLVTGRVTGQVQKFSHFPQVVTVSRVKRGMGMHIAVGPALLRYLLLKTCASSKMRNALFQSISK
jgi:hypothetical protein